MKKEERDHRIIFMYLVGTKVEKIAEEESVSLSTVYRVIREHNIPLKSDRRSTRLFTKNIIDSIVKDGKTIVEVSQDLGLPAQVVNGLVSYQKAQVSKKANNRGVKSSSNSGGVRAGLRRRLKDSSPRRRRGTSSGSFRLGLSGVGNNLGSRRPDRHMDVTKDFSRNKRGRLLRRKRMGVDALSRGLSVVGDNVVDEGSKLVLLKELLRYAASVNEFDDYSNDPLLLVDYLLPIDILISKDIHARFARGEDIGDIALVHRTDASLIQLLIDGALSREQFRDKYIESLVERGLIIL